MSFTKSGLTFAERLGAPREYHAAFGMMGLNFTYMEDAARRLIILLAGMEPSVGAIMTAELSFRGKMEAVGALGLLCASRITIEEERLAAEKELRDLLTICQQAEDLRNSYFHSFYALDGTRTKITAKRKHGLRSTVEQTDSGTLLDVADFIMEAATKVDDLPLYLRIADRVEGDGKAIRYFMGDRLVFKCDCGK